MADHSDKWKELRKPFPKEAIGQIPKGGMKLDFVGHAAVTDRLLTVDPEWTYDFKAVDERGNPMLDAEGNLWILLTVNGVTRPGVGDGPNMKERIGDALRNAAMRFGVALDLWTKDELESTLDHPELKNEKPSAKPAYPSRKPAEAPKAADVSSAHAALLGELRGKLVAASLKGDDATSFVRGVIHKDKPETNSEAQAVIDALAELEG